MHSVSVMITSRNRAADLRRTLHVLGQLNPAPLEILITADGCADTTVEMLKAETLKAEFKNLKVIINEMGKGSVASRDRMMREARGDLVLALDDDSHPERSDCLARISAPFTENPALAVLGLPQRTDEYPETLMQTDFGPTRPIRSFTSSGAVLRRSIYLQLPGFATEFFHMYEEPDYTLQCVAAGFDVVFAPNPGVTIRHHYSGTSRSELRNHLRHSRNEFWSILRRCPLPQLPLVAAYRAGSQWRFAAKYGGWRWVIREPIWWWQALEGAPDCLRHRQPVPWSAYRRWLSLK